MAVAVRVTKDIREHVILRVTQDRVRNAQVLLVLHQVPAVLLLTVLQNLQLEVPIIEAAQIITVRLRQVRDVHMKVQVPRLEVIRQVVVEVLSDLVVLDLPVEAIHVLPVVAVLVEDKYYG